MTTPPLDPRPVQAPHGSSQALTRAIDLLEALRSGPRDLKSLQAELGLSRSTVHRLASPLIERQMVVAENRRFHLGPALIHLGSRAGQQRDLIGIARPILADLTAKTEDSTNLAVRDGDEIVYVAQVPGRRRVCVRHRIGDRNAVVATALGRALMVDADAATWSRLFPGETPGSPATSGCLFHLEPDGDQIRCIGAPIRDVSGAIVAAVSLSSIPQYMDEARMYALARSVQDAARRISAELGFFGGPSA
jgi:DNA-binding IclR family transcriptional regulator